MFCNVLLLEKALDNNFSARLRNCDVNALCLSPGNSEVSSNTKMF